MESPVNDTQMERKRIEELDYVKGLAIFLVIMGHATGNLATPFWRLVIYSFHMPVFFLVSGMVMNPAEVKERGTIWTFLVKNFKALLVPYIIFSAIYSCFSYQNFGMMLYGTYETLVSAQSLTSLWFIPVMFLGRVWAELLFRALQPVTRYKQVWIAVATVAFFAVGLALPHPHPTSGTGFIGYPLGFDISLVAAGYILVGSMLLPAVKRLREVRLSLLVIGLFLSLALLACGLLVKGDAMVLDSMAFKAHNTLPTSFLNAFSGSFVVLFLAIIMYRSSCWHSPVFNKSILLFIGQNTIGIYLLHKNFMQEVVMGSFSRWGWTEPQVLVAFVSALITLIVACIGVKIINRYIPQLIGRFPQ